MTIRDHVESFLAPIDPHGALIAYAAKLLRSADADPEVCESLRAIAGWRDELVDKFAAEGLVGPAVETLGPIAYLHAVESIRIGARELGDVKSAVRRVARVLKTLEPEFGKELLADVERRAHRDPPLVTKLAEARSRFADLARRLEPIEKRLCRLIDAKEPQESSQGTGSGAIFVAPPSGDRCRDHFPAGVCIAAVVALVVIVVVTGAAK